LEDFMKRTLLCSAVIVALAGCASGGGSTAPAASADEMNKLIAQAKQEVALAGKAGGLWTTTEKQLKAAEEAQKAGDTNKAIKAAKQAIAEAQAGQKQAANGANAKPMW
jgi:hypothetical protein